MDTFNHQRKGSLLEGEDFSFNRVLSRNSSVGEDFSFNRVLSRNSSVGRSSRTLYYRSSEGVPFKWEMQPGTPKHPPKEDAIPPLSPPPAVLSLGFPKPRINVDEEPKASMRSRLVFWKQSKKNDGIKKVQAMNTDFCSNIFVNSDQFYGSDGDEEFTASSSSPGNSSSSSSSSFSFSNVRSSQSSRLQSPAREPVDQHQFYGCSPLNSILVRVATRR